MLSYPFVPKSSASLRPGHFWSIALSKGRFACGRVIQSPESGSRTTLLAGLLDWSGATPPTSASIAGAKCLEQGRIHYKSIIQTGGEVLGLRPLELDDLSPWLFRGSEFWRNSLVYEGLEPLRDQTLEDGNLPVLSTWGLAVIQIAAERHFGARL